MTEKRFASLALYLARKWVECTRTENGKAMDVALHKRSYEWLSSHKKCVAYVSKYMAKPEQLPEGATLGRFWGRIGELREVQGEALEVPPSAMVWLKRLLRRWLPKHCNPMFVKSINRQSTFVLIDCQTAVAMIRHGFDACEAMAFEAFP